MAETVATMAAVVAALVGVPVAVAMVMVVGAGAVEWIRQARETSLSRRK